MGFSFFTKTTRWLINFKHKPIISPAKNIAPYEIPAPESKKT